MAKKTIIAETQVRLGTVAWVRRGGLCVAVASPDVNVSRRFTQSMLELPEGLAGGIAYRVVKDQAVHSIVPLNTWFVDHQQFQTVTQQMGCRYGWRITAFD